MLDVSSVWEDAPNNMGKMLPDLWEGVSNLCHVDAGRGGGGAYIDPRNFIRHVDEMKKRGRPPLFGKAMTPQERQERYRARKDAALAALPDPYEEFHLGCTSEDMDRIFPGALTPTQMAARAPEFSREIESAVAHDEAAIAACLDQSDEPVIAHNKNSELG